MGDWNWNPQPRWRASGTQPEQQRDQRPERNKNAGGVNKSVGAELPPTDEDPSVGTPGEFVALLITGLHQRQSLEEEHWKDARHEVEQ